MLKESAEESGTLFNVKKSSCSGEVFEADPFGATTRYDIHSISITSITSEELYDYVPMPCPAPSPAGPKKPKTHGCGCACACALLETLVKAATPSIMQSA
jgi:hypothetical protein